VGRYRLRLAETAEDRDAACRLRFRVFNIEMGEGLESSYQTGRDTDRFDLCCEHLLVEDKQEDSPARRIVGTYRMQSGVAAARTRTAVALPTRIDTGRAARAAADATYAEIKALREQGAPDRLPAIGVPDA
jgi:putative hemolysin